MDGKVMIIGHVFKMTIPNFTASNKNLGELVTDDRLLNKTRKAGSELFSSSVAFAMFALKPFNV